MGLGTGQLGRHPGAAAAVVLTLSLGIGAGTAVFSIVSEVLLEPLPYGDPGRIALVRVDRPATPDHPLLTGAEYSAIEGAESIASASVVVSGMNLRMETDEGPESVVAAGVGADLFRVLDVQPALGRDFRGEDPATRDGVVIVTWPFWQNRLGGTLNAVGRGITLGGRTYTVVGVLPRGFDLFVGRDARGAEDAEIFLPVPVAVDNTRFAAFRTIVRLADEVDYATAQAELEVLGPNLAELAPEGPGAGTAEYRLVALHEDEVADVRPAILGLLVAVGLVVLLTCMNAAGLLVVRATRRRREYAVRAALGASRRRLVSHALTEAATLTLAAAVIGILGGTVFLDLLLVQVPVDIPRMDPVALDPRAIGLSALLAGLVTTVAGLLPALHAARVDPQASLRGFSDRIASSGSVRQGLVVGQIALSLILLLGSGLMVQTLANLRAVPLGFDPESLYVAKLVAPRPEQGAPYWPFFRKAARDLDALEGIAGASAVSRTPLAEQSDVEIVPFAAQVGEPDDDERRADLRWVLPNAFDVLGVPILEGRTFTWEEVEEARPVVVIDERIATRLWPQRSAVGRQLLIPRRFGGDPEPAVVVGVVGHQRIISPREAGRPLAFRPASHTSWGSMTLLIRSSLPPTEVFRRVRTVASRIGAADVYALAGMDRIIGEVTAGTTVATVTVGGLGITAALSALIGLYSLLAFLASGRRREIGLRIALGARPTELVVRHVAAGTRLAVLGLAIGCAVALPLSGFIEASLFGVGALDPGTWLTVCSFFLALSVLASFAPAHGAARVDPVKALRME